MKLSVIVPAYNVELYLKRCIDSVFNQGLDDFEVIIINDGSKDNTLALAKEIEKQYFPKVKVLDQDNKGLSAVRNRGIEVAEGTYVIFLDSDDFYNSNCLNYLLNNCIDHGLDVLEFGFERNTTGVAFDLSANSPIEVYTRDMFLENYFFTPYAVNKIIRRDVLLTCNIGFVEGKYMEDDYFSTELYMNCKLIGLSNMIVYNYYDNPKSITKTRNYNHELKVINDLVFSCKTHDRLYQFAKDSDFSRLALKNLKERKESIVFFMTIRMLRLKFSYKQIMGIYNQVEFDRYNVFLNNYTNEIKNIIIYRILLFCFSNRVLFRLLCKVNPF
ncbi:glycosyltransferase [Myroides odoratimimus]|uniref:glycosyltransferase family 2 protein n=1 Tax=Myroides odoratimimus TaxID=76832 RepID=UPI002DBE1548|nr:glycosyltransferase [Myroides odoratimimus]MEC4008533.1 glycosyltransferase [Myroides odoratimimus]